MIKKFEKCPHCGEWGEFQGYYMRSGNISRDAISYFGCKGFAYKCSSCGTVFMVPREERRLIRLAQVQILVPGGKRKTNKKTKKGGI